MTEQPSIINLDALRATPLNQSPFPFLVIDKFLRAEYAEAIAADFPNIPFRGSVPLTQVPYGATFARLVEDLSSTALRDAIEEKFALSLDGRATMITVRGRADKRDGRIHTDTESKFLTMLLYLNPVWAADGGRLRVLKNGKSLDDYVVEIPPTFGTCLLFKVTDNCWHGHKPFAGERRVLQLNYVRDDAARNRHLLRHRITAQLKRLRRSFRHDKQF